MRKKARAGLFGFAVVMITSGMCVQYACLPDVELVAIDGGVDASRDASVRSRCGNGIIDPFVETNEGGPTELPEQCDPGGGEAGVIGCSSLCQVECDDGGYIDPITNHCYFVAPSQNSENAAVNACGNENAHVVTFASADEVAAIANLDAGSSYWVGLAYDPGITGYASAAFILGLGGACEPGYAAACPGCFAEIADAQSPDFPGVKQQCVVVKNSGAWAGTACVDAAATPTICEREPVGIRVATQNGAFAITVAKTQSQKRYLYIPTPTSADSAVSTCNALDGGALLTLDSREEREELVREILQIRGSTTGVDFDFWIGFSQLGDGGFAWDDPDAGANLPAPWGPSEPVAANAGARAYVFIAQQTGRAVDQGLARTDDQTAHGFVCQFARSSSGPTQ